jgi:hypothetical protein
LLALIDRLLGSSDVEPDQRNGLVR